MQKLLYKLDYNTATDQTGPFFPQIETISPRLKYSDQNSIYRLFDSFQSFTNIKPQIDFAVLKKGSKLSDALSSSMFVLLGFLVSKKLKTIAEQFELPEHKFYDVPVKSEDKLYVYSWMHMLLQYKGRSFEDIQNSKVDFNESKFYIEKHLKKIDDIEITSHEELVLRGRELEFGKSIKASKVVMSESFLDEVPDVFKIPLLSNEWIVKQDLRDLILKEGITGVHMNEVTNIIFTNERTE